VRRELWWVNLEKRKQLEDPEVDGRIILRCIFRKWDEDMNWNGLSQDTDRWLAVVNAVMNFRVSYNAVNFLTS
jgi:hypothetical protein